MANRVVLCAFEGAPMCFVHVLLNALDMHRRGFEVKVVLEGAATKLARDLDDPEQPFAGLYRQVREAGLIDCACKACSAKLHADDGLARQGIRLDDAMAGHPSLARYVAEGYTVITF